MTRRKPPKLTTNPPRVLKAYVFRGVNDTWGHVVVLASTYRDARILVDHEYPNDDFHVELHLHHTYAIGPHTVPKIISSYLE